MVEWDDGRYPGVDRVGPAEPASSIPGPKRARAPAATGDDRPDRRDEGALAKTLGPARRCGALIPEELDHRNAEIGQEAAAVQDVVLSEEAGFRRRGMDGHGRVTPSSSPPADSGGAS